VLLDPERSAADGARALDGTGARVAFTLERYSAAVPESVARVLLDELPGHAEFRHLSERRSVDLGSHFGFAVEGESDVEGSDEEAVVLRDGRAPGGYASFTHRELLKAGREIVERAGIVESDDVLALIPFHRPHGFTGALLAPLLAGARLSTIAHGKHLDGAAAVARMERDGITAAVGDAAGFAAIVATLRQRARALDAPALRAAISVGEPMGTELRKQWLEATGVELREVLAPES
jgi:hypothetical protein